MTLRSSQDECDGASYARGGPYQGQYGTYDTGLFVVCLGLAKYSIGSTGLTKVCIGLIKSIYVFLQQSVKCPVHKILDLWILVMDQLPERIVTKSLEFKFRIRQNLTTWSVPDTYKRVNNSQARVKSKKNTIVSYVV